MEDKSLLNKKNLVGVCAGATFAGLGGMLVACLLAWSGLEIPRLRLLPADLSGTVYGLVRVFFPGFAGTFTYVCTSVLLNHGRFRKLADWVPDITAIGVAIVCGAFAW